MSDALATIVDALEGLQHVDNALTRGFEANCDQIERLWHDMAALRDDLHAVVNRVESVARVVFDDGQHSVKVLGEGEDNE